MSGKASKWGSFAVHTHELSEELGIEYLAYCAMKKMIDCIDTGKNKLVDVATLIGRTIEAEVRINYYIQAGGEDTERLVSAKKKKKNSSPRHQHIGIKLSVEKQLLEKGWAQDELFPTWTPEVRTGIGLFLVEAAVQAEWFVRQPKRMTKNKTENVLLPSPAVEQWLQQARNDIDAWSYLSWPLVEPPLDWEQQDQPARKNISGGYHSPLLRQVNPLCGGRKGMHSDSQFGAEAIGLLNRLQKTAWCVDHEVLKVVERCWENGTPLAVSRLLATILEGLMGCQNTSNSYQKTTKSGWLGGSNNTPSTKSITSKWRRLDPPLLRCHWLDDLPVNPGFI